MQNFVDDIGFDDIRKSWKSLYISLWDCLYLLGVRKKWRSCKKVLAAYDLMQTGNE